MIVRKPLYGIAEAGNHSAFAYWGDNGSVISNMFTLDNLAEPFLFPLGSSSIQHRQPNLGLGSPAANRATTSVGISSCRSVGHVPALAAMAITAHKH